MPLQSCNVQQTEVNKPPDVIMGNHAAATKRIYKLTRFENCMRLQL
jgi:hypothetical protein